MKAGRLADEPLSSAEASYSRALGKNIPAARGGWEEEKLKRAGNAGKGKAFGCLWLPLQITSAVFEDATIRCDAPILSHFIGTLKAYT